MKTTCVRPKSSAPTVDVLPPVFGVRWNWRAVAVSVVMAVNVATMPLVSYLSEPLPWAHDTNATALVSRCAVNVSMCTSDALRFFQAHASVVSNRNRYYHSQDLDMLQTSLRLPLENETSASWVDSLPYSFYFSLDQVRWATLVAHGELNATGNVAVSRCLGLPVLLSVLWLSRKDGDYSDKANIYFGYQIAPHAQVAAYVKCVGRVCFAVYILYYMWRHYYRHYQHLLQSLHQYGLYKARPGTVFEIIVGDPTSVILLHPIVPLFFAIDVASSPNYLASASVRVVQVANAQAFCLGCLYLSRTVLFAYGVILLASAGAKALKREHWFTTDVDPTLVAVVVVLIAGPLTLLLAQIPPLMTCFHYLFASTTDDAQATEMVYALLLYALIIGSVPVLLIVASKCRRASQKTHKVVAPAPSKRTRRTALREGWDLKQRLSMHFVYQGLPTGAVLQPVGGSVYELFARHQCCRKHLGMSLRGEDCYVLYEEAPGRVIEVRLSLLSSLDTRFLAQLQRANTGGIGSVATFPTPFCIPSFRR
ncbi:hypothetical protein SDRG_16299 [Saprolegnia diclina VS20]|uniref:Uncharacterized protein n=1 Tax=Saprolegnia diclina (strain VS20) TaxID=1156394 RepID=T0PXT6_SAPDV|nr:hypothetical protein SDRG_16299 [Saprolegnia diclina VS20]EQC25850.1 hypothetical protein SDRG_16299 [Saprolegnia diclina VS20]|eukprot:XP_008620725.1 hypothetical protein SDRG_16299 [Saprolegnia diclina VS20]